MKTKRMISTVGYNTEEFLVKTCNELVDIGALEWWFAINHQPEIDETKKHWHIVMQPSAPLDTVSLRKQFDEPDPNNDLPLGVLPIRATKSFEDWYLYAIHHKGYLLWKGETRQYHYQFDDIIGSDIELLLEMVNEANISKYRCYEEIFLAAERHVPFSSLVAEGLVPLNYICQFRTLYDCIIADSVNPLSRGGSLGHDTVVHYGIDPFN